MDVPANTDAHPICHPLTLGLWLSRFMPSLGSRSLLPSQAQLASGLLALGLLAGTGMLLARSSARGRALALAAISGTSGMLLQGALLLAFQARHGVLYGDLGLVLTLFMLGLAAGAFLPRLGVRPVTCALALVALAAAPAVAQPARLAWGPAALLLGLSGLASGALFGVAGRTLPGEGGSLYGADLAGGCLGALCAGLLLPFTGLAAGPILVAILALGATLLLGGKVRPDGQLSSPRG
jgi:hypothetical protein